METGVDEEDAATEDEDSATEEELAITVNVPQPAVPDAPKASVPLACTV